jgi:hypothetical protein
MKEAGRRCQRCQFAWYATPPGGNPGKPRWFDEAGSFWTDGQARMARRTANFDRHLQAKDAWEKCPNCGSRKVKTDNSRAFRPTGAVAPPTSAYASPSMPPVAQFGVASPPTSYGSAPTGGSTAQTSPHASGASMWQRLGKFHAQHWRLIWFVIFALAPFGSLGDEEVYTRGTAANVATFIGILIGCWAVAGFFLFLHLRHRRHGI